jgi:hypothetical protein
MKGRYQNSKSMLGSSPVGAVVAEKRRWTRACSKPHHWIVSTERDGGLKSDHSRPALGTLAKISASTRIDGRAARLFENLGRQALCPALGSFGFELARVVNDECLDVGCVYRPRHHLMCGNKTVVTVSRMCAPTSSSYVRSIASLRNRASVRNMVAFQRPRRRVVPAPSLAN